MFRLWFSVSLIFHWLRCSAAADGKCRDKQYPGSNCARQPYNTSIVSDSDACCALCASEKKCQQWTFDYRSKHCARTASHEALQRGIFTLLLTCGIKFKPPPPPPPVPPPSPAMAHNWAVIAAGSSGYMNYRHQADACHAYQVMLRSGIAPDHIILMMQDDVAGDRENPFPSQLFNKAGSTVDVYAGCKVDYRGHVVTKDLFKKVITGDESAGGKVLKSGPHDRVFINFVDHGGVGIVAFPNGSPLQARELSDTLKTMQSKKMFNELVFYMEACESGSMFPDLSTDGKILAVTAANARESSWGYYCPPNDAANGQHMNACLGDLFSISWMEDSDLGQHSTESLKTQIQRVTKRTNKSHVQTFGDKSFENEVIGHFESMVPVEPGRPAPTHLINAVDTRDIHLQYYVNKVEIAKTSDDKAAAQQELDRTISDRKADAELFSTFAHEACKGGSSGCQEKLMNDKEQLEDHACHGALVDVVFEKCPVRGPNAPGGWNSYNMQFSQVLVNACQMRSAGSDHTKELIKILAPECSKSADMLSTVVV